MSEPRIAERDIEAATRATAGASPEVYALALDVLSRQGEAQLLFAGKDYVRARAQAHGVAEGTEVAGEDLLAVLERGPASTKEHAIVCALAVHGLRAHLDDPERLARFVRHADWLTFGTPYCVYAFVEPVLGDDARVVWQQVVAAPVPPGPRGAAIAALRRAVLPPELAAVERRDPDSFRITGRLGVWPPSGLRGLLRLLSGWALLQWLGRLVAWTLSVRREGELTLRGSSIRLTARTTTLGRVVRERLETFPLAALASAGRTTRYPTLPLLAGSLAFAVGMIAGAVFLFEGMWSGETVLLLVGAGLVVGGGGLDLALSVLAPGTRRQVNIEIAVLPRRRLRLTGVDESEAQAFLDMLCERLEAHGR